MSAHGDRHPIDALVARLLRREAGAIVSTLTRILGAHHVELAEDVAQDAMVKALEHWPYTGVPDRPAHWLVQAAKHRAIDLLRRRALFEEKIARAIAEMEPIAESSEGPTDAPDDVLGMLFMCCHPSLAREARVVLALKSVAGLGVPEIARAFLADEAAIAQRIVRAKRQIREEGIVFEWPRGAQLLARVGPVLEVLYLWFNEGYGAHEGDALVRAELCEEAIRLAVRVAAHPETGSPSCHALVALMLFQAARLPARVDGEGNLLLLRDQNRSQWDARLVHLGLRHLERASAGDALSAYHYEAAIAACHATAPSYRETDWAQIVELYDRLHAIKPSPVVALHRAIASSRLAGPRAGIEAIEAIAGDPALARYPLLPAILAELHTEAGERDRALPLYRRALEGPCSKPQRRFLEMRLMRVSTDRDPYPEGEPG